MPGRISTPGAAAALDFTDAGYPSTHRLTDAEREQVLEIPVARTAADGIETILVEVADGLLFPDTARLLGSPKFRRLVDGVVYAAADAMGALAGADWLSRRGLPLFGRSAAHLRRTERRSAALAASPIARARWSGLVRATGDLAATGLPMAMIALWQATGAGEAGAVGAALAVSLSRRGCESWPASASIVSSPTAPRKGSRPFLHARRSSCTRPHRGCRAAVDDWSFEGFPSRADSRRGLVRQRGQCRRQRWHGTGGGAGCIARRSRRIRSAPTPPPGGRSGPILRSLLAGRDLG
jgi:hypothetical protein